MVVGLAASFTYHALYDQVRWLTYPVGSNEWRPAPAVEWRPVPPCLVITYRGATSVINAVF